MTKTTYFKVTPQIDLAEIKQQYRELCKKFHPDLNPDNPETAAEAMKAINAEYEDILKDLMSNAFNAYQQERKDSGAETWEQDMTPFADILAQILHMDDIDIEIIGFWIYAFNSFTRRDELKDLGFWFSSKHRAWVYSGTAKRRVPSKLTLDQIKAKYGSDKVNTIHREKLEEEEVASA